jgi:D-arabinose 1-dehydrogenase-like Zn-dependent alcohol dehydrogenase
LVGVIKEMGSEAPNHSDLKVGDRVGMGWFQRQVLNHQVILPVC